MIELEKGDLRGGGGKEEEALLLRKRVMAPNIYYKIMAFVVILVLLWQHSFLTFARRPLNYSRQPVGVPQFVLDYAPLVWLDESEAYFPSDIYSQVENTTPLVNNYSAIPGAPHPLTLENLDALNAYANNGSTIYLTSKVDVTTSPRWLEGVVPTSSGKTENAVSCAIIVNDHGSGLVDAFYMYFYAYNLGNVVLFRELGDHIGDWEHNMIRFQDEEPQTIWYSQHANGQAFTYNAVEKKRHPTNLLLCNRQPCQLRCSRDP